MIKDMLALPENERLICITQLMANNKPNHIATIGKIIHHQSLTDGRSNIVLHGIQTVEIEELNDTITPYKQGKIINIRPEYWENENNKTTLTDKLLHSMNEFSKRSRIIVEDLNKIPAEDLLNGIIFTLQLSPLDKQQLLNEQKLNIRLEELIKILNNIGYYTKYIPDNEIERGTN